MTFPINNALVRALNNSDEKIFQDLYDHYSAPIFRNIYKMLPRQQEAEDLLQSVFLQLWENRLQFTPKQSVPGWLFTTSFYMTMDRLRFITRTRLNSLEVVIDLPDTDESEAAGDNYLQKVKLLNLAIGLLPARKKQAFELCRIEGKSYQEAASMLNISEETVKDYVKSAMQMLKKNALQADLSLYLLLISMLP